MKIQNPIAFIAIAIVMVVITPMISITAINALFGMQIEINMITWLAAFWFHVVAGLISFNKN